MEGFPAPAVLLRMTAQLPLTPDLGTPAAKIFLVTTTFRDLTAKPLPPTHS